MTPMEYGTTTACELIGGPLDGLSIRIDDCRGLVAFMAHSIHVETVKSCGVPTIKTPFYERTKENRFKFVGYR